MFNLNYSLLMASCLFLISCGNNSSKVVDCPNPNSSTKTEPVAKESNIEKINILIDATSSMEGFVNSSSESRYESTLDILDAATNVVTNQSGVKYYAFGTDKKEITSGDYTEALRPEFYRSSGILKDTQLNEKILAPIEGNQISLIITDLYLTDDKRFANNNINSVTELLKREYLEKGYAVGILGVRSEFKGKIYDIGRDSEIRDWSSNDADPNTFRPFYIIFLGTYENIYQYFMQISDLEGTAEFIQEDRFIIFDSSIFEETSVFDLSKENPEFLLTSTALRPAANLDDGETSVNFSDPDSIASFAISDEAQPSDSESVIRYTIPYYPRPFTVPIDFSSEDNTFSKSLDVISLEESDIEDNDNSSQENKNKLIEKSLQFEKWSYEDNQSRKELGFHLRVNPETFPKGLYQVNATLIPQSFQSLDEIGWESWSFPESDFIRGKPLAFNEGNKTLNLSLFLNTLQSITTAKLKPAAYLCFAIQKD